MCHNYHNPPEATPHRDSKPHACYPPPVSGSILVKPSSQASLWITPPTVRNVGAGDLRSAVAPETHGTLFLTVHCYSCCLLTAVGLPHAAQLTSTVPSTKTMPIFISRRDALVINTSLLKRRNGFPRGLWRTLLFFHWTNGITWLARKLRPSDWLKPNHDPPLETGIWSFPLQHKFYISVQIWVQLDLYCHCNNICCDVS